jgi:hypothetical protein
MMVAQLGILAIWNDCRPGHEAEFEAWFQGEHLLERLAVPGFLFGRRHQAITGASSYFNFYLTQSPDVLTSEPYLERLDNPTSMTRKIMSKIFINANRTVCHRIVRRGGFRGSYAVTVRFKEAIDGVALTARLEALVQEEAVAGGEIWSAANPRDMPMSMEEKLRGGDRKIHGCLMIDTLRQHDAEKLGGQLSQQYPNADVGVFRVLCHLGRGDL